MVESPCALLTLERKGAGAELALKDLQGGLDQYISQSVVRVECFILMFGSSNGMLFCLHDTSSQAGGSCMKHCDPFPNDLPGV